jgi:hypothetical protein
MNQDIVDFIAILQVHSVAFKFYEIESISSSDPRWDKWEFNEELLIEEVIFSNDEFEELTDFLFIDFSDYWHGKSRSVLLDGFTQPVDLENHFEEEFEKFRIALATEQSQKEESELREIIQQVKYARNELDIIQMSNRNNNFRLFDSLLETKKEFCLETIRFLRLSLAGLPKEEKDYSDYYFTIMPKCSPKIHYILSYMHKKLEAEGYVSCTVDEFKEVFTSKNPKPIKWYKPLCHLTYMIKKMTGSLLIEKIKPSNNYIAEKYFNIYKNGILFPPKRLRHDDDPNPKGKEFIDNLIENAIGDYVE